MKKLAIDFICIAFAFSTYSCDKKQSTLRYNIASVVTKGVNCEYTAISKNQPIVKFNDECDKYKVGDTWKYVVTN